MHTQSDIIPRKQNVTKSAARWEVGKKEREKKQTEQTGKTEERKKREEKDTERAWACVSE